jgi:hypothetical protein
MAMSDFYRGKKCHICGKPATRGHFGVVLCDSEKCLCEARDTRECIGKTMKPGPVSVDDLLKGMKK